MALTNPCACGKYEAGTRTNVAPGQTSDGHFGNACMFADGTVVNRGDAERAALGQSGYHMRPDHGRVLAESLMAQNLADIDTVLRKALATLDEDEGGAGFQVEHNHNCPDYSGQHRRSCACGLAKMIQDLKDATEVLEAVQIQLAALRGAPKEDR